MNVLKEIRIVRIARTLKTASIIKDIYDNRIRLLLTTAVYFPSDFYRTANAFFARFRAHTSTISPKRRS